MSYKKFDDNTVRTVFDKSNGRCWYCGYVLNIESRFQSVNQRMYVIDHLFPKKRGGTDDISNLVPACWTCNGMKRTYTLDEFREVLTRLDNNVPKFSVEHLFYLQRIGVELPTYKPHIFYFEEKGLTP